MSNFHIQEPTDDIPRVKPPPNTSSIPVPFSYSASNDGTDENLLILLHGLGDTHVPFAKLGRQLNLPQTAVLALRAPEQIPYLYEEAYQWYASFDTLGGLVEGPNPTSALDLLGKLIGHLTNDLHWPLDRIHLFGFGQGGSVAAETCVQRGRLSEGPREHSFGSIVTVSGPLLSYPTISSPSPTPVLVVHRPSPSEEALPPAALKSFQRGFQSVTDATLSAKRSGMPGAKEEWEPIMRFWSEKLSRRKVEGLYEVMSGTAT